MRVYRVGGSVRDHIRGRPAKDQDFVVVGATVDEFKSAYPDAQLVGKDFPVFICEQGEFAFARRERKVGMGHRGFSIEFDTTVTLEEDLSRRDLTCNAMALDEAGNIVDPFNGQADIKAGVLRHVGEAFRDDPLRVFRLARFAAQLGWEVAPETIEMAYSVDHEDILSLSGERICGEFRKAMVSQDPARFFEVLRATGHLQGWFQEVEDITWVPAGPSGCHAEGDTFTHTMMALRELPSDASEAVRVAVLMHDLGKGVTPKDQWPFHRGHAEAGVPVVQAMCKRIRLPNDLTAAAVVACRQHMRAHGFCDMRGGKMVDLVEAADRTILKAEGLAAVIEADSAGRIPPVGSEGAAAIRRTAHAIRAERGHPIPASLEGPNIRLHVRACKGRAATMALASE